MSETKVVGAESAAQKTPTKRITKPGMVRVMVSITQENADSLTRMAKEESPVFPRALNEYLSILIEKRFEELTGE